MRIWLLAIGLLAAACVAREQSAVSPSRQRFEGDWNSARDWSEAIAEWRSNVQPPTAYPHTTAAFGAEHVNKLGLHIGEWKGGQDSGRRKREVMAVTYRIILPVTGIGEFEPMPMPESSYAWRVPLGSMLRGDAAIAATPEGGLWTTAPESRSWSSARVVFRIGLEPTPTRLYKHGSEILVAAWGMALEPVSIELTDSDGDEYWVFLQESGPE